ncbi:unnamed protein product [Mytilus coruscus]|uniref:Uncharacterized protein n=1 Tax=Mytilus coruscus TaxID=42192 RepID=A0A6J8BTC1_MYTCO|nr:unnamed protein product [Mytilus coruscus]
MNATQKHTWTDEQYATILEHQAFHEYDYFLNKVVMEGSTKTFPRKPKSNLETNRIDSSANVLTDDVIARHTQFSGGIGQTLDSLYQYSVAARTAVLHSTGSARNNEKDIVTFCRLGKRKTHFSCKDRTFSDFSTFVHTQNQIPGLFFKNGPTVH